MINIMALIALASISLLMLPTSFLLHEWAHCLEAFRQGVKECRIFVRPTTMLATASNIKNYKTFYYAGGLLSGITLLLVGLFAMWTPTKWDFPFEFSFILFGLMNLAYSPFEGIFLPRWGDTLKYKLGRYSIYLAVAAIVIALYWSRIVSFCQIT